MERLRNRLKLSGWEKIKERYNLVGDEKVAEKIDNLKTTNNIEYEEKYGVWSNRFTDFEMEWKQIKNPATNTVEGQLRAVGCMRVENLGMISAGCYAVIMSGPLNANPLPSTKVTALRVHHLSLSIRFMTPQRFENPYIQGHNQSIRFKLGKHNKMFGEAAVKDNLFTFKNKKAEDSKKAEKIISNAFKEVIQYIKTDTNGGNQRGPNPHEEDPEGEEEFDNGHDFDELDNSNEGYNSDDEETQVPQSHRPGGNRTGHSSSHTQYSQYRFPGRQHRDSYRYSQEMEEAISQTHRMTLGENDKRVSFLGRPDDSVEKDGAAASEQPVHDQQEYGATGSQVVNI